ncbi:hypothetical protein MWU75_13320 [Ornithinimicrobium sp. F0845]|uniref:AMIN-like domain-containing (lipo)protein n=1 Tax=Ornithinimicrobium sp. F0845 TaxID=2926412 RepID=UPI001FF24E69|nr:hypothetical protein [Ornithinimicrobium sp. F0845]MCK0113124.1 hypothetical protein [Ornithinimicrobium sp. F0845]
MSTIRSHRTSRAWAALALAAALGLGAPALASPPDSTAYSRSSSTGISAVMQGSPYCGIYWGSLAKTNGTSHTTGTVDDVRAGRHACYDRLVIDVDDVPGSLTYDVRYVDTVREDGSGAAVPLAGGADLQVIVRAPAYEGGAATYSPADPAHLVHVKGWTTFRQVAMAGSFEGQTTVGLGVRARLPFRSFVLDGPGDGARLVIDVAHRW